MSVEAEIHAICYGKNFYAKMLNSRYEPIIDRPNPPNFISKCRITCPLDISRSHLVFGPLRACENPLHAPCICHQIIHKLHLVTGIAVSCLEAQYPPSPFPSRSRHPSRNVLTLRERRGVFVSGIYPVPSHALASGEAVCLLCKLLLAKGRKLPI